MKHGILCVAVALMVLGAAVAQARGVDVPLSVVNREGVSRPAEPVTSGVPFAQGTLRDAGLVRLVGDGGEVPAQFLATARWPDGSIRWMLVDFQVDLPASGSRSVTLQTGVRPQAVSGITLTSDATTLSVDTQAATFLFNKAELLVRGQSFQVQSDGATYRAVPTNWTIEEQGPMKVVVRVAGVWRSGGMPLRNDLNRFLARLVFLRGKDEARVWLTFRNGNSFGWDEAGGGQPRQADVVLTGAGFGPAALLAAGGGHHLGSGVEKTWETVVPASGAPIVRTTRFAANGSLVGGDAPPRPLAAAPPDYYASTRAWGRIGLPVGGQSADRQPDFDRFERIQRAKVDQSAVENPPGLTGVTVWGHLSRDLSSWNDYGDLRWDGNGCGTLSSNHYDWSYGMFLHFMRTGQLGFADAARVIARHEIDFDIYHTGADGAAFNYQKNWEDRPSHDNPDNCFGGGRPSHTWSQGYALQWLLTGDRRGKDAFDEIQEGVRQYVYESFNGEGHVDTPELRIQGWLVENLVNLWRIDPDARLSTSGFGAKSIPAAIQDVLRNVFDREAAAGRAGFVISDADEGGNLRQPLVHAYFLEPAIKAYDEVFAGRDSAYAQTLLGLVRRMTNWLISITYGGDTDGAGGYRPRQIPYWVDVRVAQQTDGQLPYLLMAANAAGYLFAATGESAWRDYASAAFQDYVRYVGAIGPDSYGDPNARTPASYNSNMFPGTESKIHGWSSRYGQYFLAASAGGAPAPGTPPGPPSGLVASSSGSTVQLRWTAPASGGSPTAYVIEAGSAPGLANLANFSTGNTATTFQSGGVANGTYYLRVRASNASGTSGPSNEAALVVGGGEGGAPGAPSGLVASSSGSSVQLQWTAPSSGGSPAAYVIEAGSAPGLADLANFSTGSTATSFAGSGVGAGTYYVRVRATNGSGTSGPSNEAILNVGGGLAKQAGLSALFANVGEGGLVPVIVGFRAGFTVPEGLLASAAVARQRESIGRVREGILAQMPRGSVGSVKRYDTIPYFSAVVSADALRIFGGLEEVDSVVEDIAEPPSADADLGLVAASPLWAAGIDGSGWSVAVLDTGIDQARAFLAPRIVSEACYSTNSRVSSALCPGGEQTSTAAGAGGRCPDNVSGCDHATGVARVVAGDGGGVTGLAPGASIVSVQVFSRFEGRDYCTAATPCALSWASDQLAALERVLALTGTHKIAAVVLSLGAGKFGGGAACGRADGRDAAIGHLRSSGVATVIVSGRETCGASVVMPAGAHVLSAAIWKPPVVSPTGVEGKK